MSMLMNRELHDLRHRMNRLFQDSDGTQNAPAPGTWVPPVDVSESPTEIVIQIELPGLRKDEIDIQLTGDTLRISGERRPQELARSEHYHRIERSYGAFSRAFQIETAIEAGDVVASYEDGVLSITLPKREAVRPRQIPIQGS